MRVVLVDTSFLVALVDPRDRYHEQAVGLSSELDTASVRLLTTDAVLIELANYFSRSPLRVEAVAWVDAIRSSQEWEVVPIDRPLILRGEARYRRHDDKTWSLTDRISMEVMRAREISEAATFDADFEQAGFRALLRSSP
jgi:predicted nucleic acid-binding protein